MRCYRRTLPSSSSFVKILILFTILVLLYGELMVYYINSYQWNTLPSINKKKSIRILLVSDPQIQGYEYEPVFPFGAITRWDSDRYLAQTFTKAVKHIQPDMIIFLGDLMDEGSIATDEIYMKYRRRFVNIFPMRDTVKLFIPGDNDIGGEGTDEVTDHKTNRFRHLFYEDEHVTFKFAEFSRVNFFTRAAEKTNLTSNQKRILVTHFPLLPVAKIFGREVITKTKPDLIFSGHDHSSMHFVGEKNGTLLYQESYDQKDQSWTIDTNKNLHEILVPTCSYRMGKEKMGYGFAIIEENGLVYYTILWLPDRYCYFAVTENIYEISPV